MRSKQPNYILKPKFYNTHKKRSTMNKCLRSLAFVSSLLACSHMHAVEAFAKLTPSITKNANSLAHNLSEELELVYLNLFALLNSSEETPALIKCIEYIEECPDMVDSSQQFSNDAIQTMQTYATNVQEKIARKKDISEDEQERLWTKLEEKIQELMAYIHAIYYKIIYNDVATKNPSALKYMFDENGLITQENRTRSLPQPW